VARNLYLTGLTQAASIAQPATFALRQVQRPINAVRGEKVP
jgi:hypothetical protein